MERAKSESTKAPLDLMRQRSENARTLVDAKGAVLDRQEQMADIEQKRAMTYATLAKAGIDLRGARVDQANALIDAISGLVSAARRS